MNAPRKALLRADDAWDDSPARRSREKKEMKNEAKPDMKDAVCAFLLWDECGHA